MEMDRQIWGESDNRILGDGQADVGGGGHQI